MATIEVILRDDAGQLIDGLERRIYEVDLGDRRVHGIEGAVESFKQRALPDITGEFLRDAQREFGAKKNRV